MSPVQAANELINSRDVKIVTLTTQRDKLLVACQKLLAYHQWAKGSGGLYTEPPDPEVEVIAAIALVCPDTVSSKATAAQPERSS